MELCRFSVTKPCALSHARSPTRSVKTHHRLDHARERARAAAVIMKRILPKYGYPADKQEKATQTVLEQVELLGWEVAA